MKNYSSFRRAPPPLHAQAHTDTNTYTHPGLSHSKSAERSRSKAQKPLRQGLGLSFVPPRSARPAPARGGSSAELRSAERSRQPGRGAGALPGQSRIGVRSDAGPGYGAMLVPGTEKCSPVARSSVSRSRTAKRAAPRISVSGFLFISQVKKPPHSIQRCTSSPSELIPQEQNSTKPCNSLCHRQKKKKNWF